MTLHLSILLWLPAAAALAGLLGGRTVARILAPTAARAHGRPARSCVVADFDSRRRGLQYVTDKMWISELGIHYKLGVDGLNLFLILLTACCSPPTVLWALRREWERERRLLASPRLAETAVLGALMAQDLALFVAFFDLMLIPFFFLAGIWGPAATRVPAVTKLVIYTLVGSLLMLAAAIATGVLAAQQGGGEPVLRVLRPGQHAPAAKGSQEWIFLCFAAAFLVKMPLFPLHGWMPDGYRAMPLPVLAVFSGGAVEGRRLRLPARRHCRCSPTPRRTSRTSCC